MAAEKKTSKSPKVKTPKEGKGTKGGKTAKSANSGGHAAKNGCCTQTATGKAPKVYSHPKSFAGLVVAFAAFLPCLGGCLQPNMNPLERALNTTMVEVVKPAVSEAIDKLDPDSAQLQGQASLINPGYVIEWQATAGPATCGKIAISVSGVSANIAGATQASPVQPAKTETEVPVPANEKTPQ